MDTDIKKRKLFTVKDHIVLAVFAAAAMILTYDNFFGTEPQRFGLNIPLVYILFEAVIFLLKKTEADITPIR